MTRPDTLLLVMETGKGNVVGYCRFEIVLNPIYSAEISVCVAKNLRGKGLGLELIRHGCRELSVRFPTIRTIRAFVKSTNLAYYTVFERSGFERLEEVERTGGTATAFEFRMSELRG